MNPGEHEAIMRRYYAARAPLMRYENLDARVARTLDEYAAYIAAKLQGRRVLEVACGTGFWTQKLAERADWVLATDAVSEMIAEAQARPYSRRNVGFALSDAFTLDGASGGWDGGFHVQWISHVPRSRMDQFLSAFHGRLLPGATVVFGDNKDRGVDPDAEGNLYQERVLPSGARYRIIKNWPDEAELRDILRPYARELEFQSFERDWFVSYTTPLRSEHDSRSLSVARFSDRIDRGNLRQGSGRASTDPHGKAPPTGSATSNSAGRVRAPADAGTLFRQSGGGALYEAHGRPQIQVDPWIRAPACAASGVRLGSVSSPSSTRCLEGTSP